MSAMSNLQTLVSQALNKEDAAGFYFAAQRAKVDTTDLDGAMAIIAQKWGDSGLQLLSRNADSNSSTHSSLRNRASAVRSNASHSGSVSQMRMASTSAVSDSNGLSTFSGQVFSLPIVASNEPIVIKRPVPRASSSEPAPAQEIEAYQESSASSADNDCMHRTIEKIRPYSADILAMIACTTTAVFVPGLGLFMGATYAARRIWSMF